MPFYYKNSSGKPIKAISKINMCEKRGMMSVCRAATIKDQHGCKFRVPSSRGDHCCHFRETICNACDSVLAQSGKEPYDCKECQFYKKCIKKGAENECTLAEKEKEIGTQQARKIEEALGVVTDPPAMATYVDAVGRRLVAFAAS